MMARLVRPDPLAHTSLLRFTLYHLCTATLTPDRGLTVVR